MKKALLLALLLCLPAFAGAISWLENDYSFGSNGFKKDSLTFFTNVSTRIVTGANAGFYEDRGLYRDKVFSFRMPIMYSAENFFLSASPFFYPSLHRSKAQGAKMYLLVPVSEEDDKSYLHLVLSGAAVRQETTLNLAGGPAKKAFTETALELQAEKSYYNQFFFLATAAGFMESGPASNANLVNPVLDHGEIASLGTFRPVHGMPEWAMGVQVARNMAPEYESSIYLGYSRISFRNANTAGSLLGGIKLKLNSRSSFDFGYNFYKIKGEAAKSYFKFLVQVFFGTGQQGD
ncbi:MAG: hypothetical protein A3J79_10460 [Elusimicrobia bacterium RIFOXYB2_FULL_62_6]|nr:MAG: hypothetical protein A3J79_10460 [Elusimicrobia bacterium RIFOXYB2_FULL_62_6]